MARSSDRRSFKNVKVTWRFGSSSSKRSDKSIAMDKRFSDDLQKLVVDKGRANLDLRVSILSAQLQSIITRSYQQAWSFAMRNLLGLQSRKGVRRIDFYQFEHPTTAGRLVSGTHLRGLTQTKFIRDAIEWSPLTYKHIRRKTGRVTKGIKYNTEYWKFKGDLINEMKGLGRNAVKGLGEPQITVRKISKKTQVANNDFTRTHTMSIRLMPNIPRSALPGLADERLNKPDLSMRFERALGFSDHSLAKLHGPDSLEGIVHRPFFQPVFTYWTLFHIPNDMARAFNQVAGRLNPSRQE